MNTIHQELVRHYDERHYETDEPITDEMLAMDQADFLNKVGWSNSIYDSLVKGSSTAVSPSPGTVTMAIRSRWR